VFPFSLPKRVENRERSYSNLKECKAGAKKKIGCQRKKRRRTKTYFRSSALSVPFPENPEGGENKGETPQNTRKTNGRKKRSALPIGHGQLGEEDLSANGKKGGGERQGIAV